MATFTSPCQASVLNKVDPDSVSMPTLIESTFQRDYVMPKVTIKKELKKEVEASLPPDYLPEDSGNRILPTTFYHFYRNCITASIGEKLELKFTDDTPDWKKTGKIDAANYWLKPNSKTTKKKTNENDESNINVTNSSNDQHENENSDPIENGTGLEYDMNGCNYPC